MNKSRFGKKSSTPEKPTMRFSKLTSFIIIGTFIAAIVSIGIIAFPKSSNTVEASVQSKSQDKMKFNATRKIIVDKETGELRRPNDKELKELVDSLSSLTKRSSKNLPTTNLSNGGESLNLESGFQGVILARPKADGTMETRCVFTFEEGAEFLGLVKDDSK